MQLLSHRSMQKSSHTRMLNSSQQISPPASLPGSRVCSQSFHAVNRKRKRQPYNKIIISLFFVSIVIVSAIYCELTGVAKGVLDSRQFPKQNNQTKHYSVRTSTEKKYAYKAMNPEYVTPSTKDEESEVISTIVDDNNKNNSKSLDNKPDIDHEVVEQGHNDPKIKSGDEATLFDNDEDGEEGDRESVFLNYFTKYMRTLTTPDVPFLIRDGKLYCRKSHIKILNQDSGSRRYKWYAQMIQAALQIKVETDGHYGQVVTKIKGPGPGLPIIANWGDGCGCKSPDLNYRKLPRLTWSFPIPPVEGCNPVGTPGYRAWKYNHDKTSSSEWDEIFIENERKYPWSKKIKMAVWRGGTTGQAKKENGSWSLSSLPRANLVQHSIENPELIDAAFHKLTQTFSGRKELESQTRIAPPIIIDDFMKYRAIVDIDGNGWSSRFGDLLCMNSVVIKVQPDFGEMFYKDIKPWMHYIPVFSNMTDLVDAATFVADDSNSKKVKEIIHNAHNWCRKAFLRDSIARDMLDILVEYSDMIESEDKYWKPNWEQNLIFSGSEFSDLVECKD